MYTEGFDEFDGYRDGERSTKRAYVSNVSNDEAERLSRENEQLKQALEKEQFFNKLLDQEIQELKAKNGQTEPLISSYWYGSRGVSKGAFYTLLFVALGMAGYIGYGIYNDKQSGSSRGAIPSAQVTSGEEAPTFSTPTGNNQGNITGEAQPSADEKINNTTPVASTPTEEPQNQKPQVKDSVPNIVARIEPETRQPVQQAEKSQQNPPPVRENAQPAKPTVPEVDVEKQVTNTSPEVVDTRPVIARYQVSSKANFYSRPDENSMRDIFISHGEDKIVGALEDRNGFIYVVYTNDLGYTTKGWLSKQDLTKMD